MHMQGQVLGGRRQLLLEDLDFADDLALISSMYTQIQKIDHLNRNGNGMGMKISTTKIKLMRINANNSNAVIGRGCGQL